MLSTRSRSTGGERRYCLNWSINDVTLIKAAHHPGRLASAPATLFWSLEPSPELTGPRSGRCVPVWRHTPDPATFRCQSVSGHGRSGIRAGGPRPLGATEAHLSVPRLACRRVVAGFITQRRPTCGVRPPRSSRASEPGCIALASRPDQGRPVVDGSTLTSVLWPTEAWPTEAWPTQAWPTQAWPTEARWPGSRRARTQQGDDLDDSTWSELTVYPRGTCGDDRPESPATPRAFVAAGALQAGSEDACGVSRRRPALGDAQVFARRAGSRAPTCGSSKPTGTGRTLSKTSIRQPRPGSLSEAMTHVGIRTVSGANIPAADAPISGTRERPAADTDGRPTNALPCGPILRTAPPTGLLGEPAPQPGRGRRATRPPTPPRAPPACAVRPGLLRDLRAHARLSSSPGAFPARSHWPNDFLEDRNVESGDHSGIPARPAPALPPAPPFLPQSEVSDRYNHEEVTIGCIPELERERVSTVLSTDRFIPSFS